MTSPTDRTDFRTAIARTGVLAKLAAFMPRVAGTLPLGIAVPSSDIDILCEAVDATAFAECVRHHFERSEDFALRRVARVRRPVIASFVAFGWPFELYAEALPVEEQDGWRHFTVEERLLKLGGTPLRDAVLALRRRGLKTEPAFARILGLRGDPYRAISDLHERHDAELRALIDGPALAR